MYATSQSADGGVPDADDKLYTTTIDFNTLVQEMQVVFPITGKAIKSSTAAGPVDYSVFSSYLLKSIKEQETNRQQETIKQQATIKQQEAEIKNLKNQYNALLERVVKLEKK